MKGDGVPKGRGSNKKGGGPTPPKEQVQEVQMDGLELMVTRRQLEQAILEKQQIQARAQQLFQALVGVLDTKRGKSATVQLDRIPKALQKYPRIETNVDEEAGTLTIELAEAADDDAN